MFTINNSSFKS